MNKSWKGVIHYRSKLILSFLFSSQERKACFEWEFSIVKKIAGKIEISRTTSQYVKRHFFQFGKQVIQLESQPLATAVIVMIYRPQQKGEITHFAHFSYFSKNSAKIKPVNRWHFLRNKQFIISKSRCTKNFRIFSNRYAYFSQL